MNERAFIDVMRELFTTCARCVCSFTSKYKGIFHLTKYLVILWEMQEYLLEFGKFNKRKV